MDTLEMSRLRFWLPSLSKPDACRIRSRIQLPVQYVACQPICPHQCLFKSEAHQTSSIFTCPTGGLQQGRNRKPTSWSGKLSLCAIPSRVSALRHTANKSINLAVFLTLTQYIFARPFAPSAMQMSVKERTQSCGNIRVKMSFSRKALVPGAIAHRRTRSWESQGQQKGTEV